MIHVIWSAVIVAALALYLRQVYSRFKKYNVKHFKPIPLLGNLGRVMLRMDHFTEDVDKLYKAFPEER